MSMHIKNGKYSLVKRMLPKDKFLYKKEDIMFISNKFSALAIDMESASVAQVCYINGLNFLCIKIISDSVFQEKDYKNIAN